MPLFVRNATIQEMVKRGAAGVRAEMQADRDRLADELKATRERSVQIQEMLSHRILTLQEYASKYTGNDYRSYPAGVKAITEKYTNRSEWGCLQTRAIIDLRAAFILGDGIKVVHKTKTKADAQRELDWARDFISYNELDAEMPQAIAKEAEIEGKIALRLFWQAEKDGWRGHSGMVSVRFLSWLHNNYTVHADPADYLWYKKLTWPAKMSSPPQPGGDVPEGEFVYKKFGGRMHDPNDAQPVILGCLTQIDRLDKALRDLREINHLFASPTPDFKMETAQQAAAFLAWLDKTNWKFGKAIVHIGEFSIKGPDTAGVANLDKEIETNTKLISGTTGIPPHFLGFVDLLSTRATGDNTREQVMAATTSDRKIWQGAFNELLAKSMELYNEKTGAAQKKASRLDPEKVGVEIPLISEEHWRHIASVYLPAEAQGVISKDFVASQIPGVDIDEEATRRLEADETALKAAAAELARLKAERLAGRQAGAELEAEAEGAEA